MNPRVLGSVVVVAIFALGARDTGCIGYSEPSRAPQACPAIGCDPNCPAGTKVDANGCETCECVPTEHVACSTDADCAADEACTKVTCVTAPCEPRCEKKSPPGTSSCWQDTDCATGEYCDMKNYCDPPPGCDPTTMACPPVCYGRCVSGGSSSTCKGAFLDASGACVNPDGTVAAPECCKAPPPPAKCGDGSVTTCKSLPNCEAPYVAGPWQGCWACFDPNTCNRACTTDSECGVGLSCQPDPTDPCNGPTVDCFRAGRMYCAPQACDGVVCDMYCEHGFDTDPATGCAICKCHEEPSCNCTKEYMPVCGTDGNTYGNECEANCAGVKAASAGECPQCTVTCKTPTPVCGEDGVTYQCGEPDALCHNTHVAYDGECGTNCNIQCFVADPVCGSDGVTYGCGEVEAKCHGASVVHAGECGQICKADSECAKDETCFISSVARRVYGECRPTGYCEVPDDCLRYAQPVIACVGSWTCPKNQCQYVCGP